MELVSVGESLNTTAGDIEPGEFDEDGLLMTKADRSNRWMIMMVTVGMFVAFRNCFVGFIAGCLCWALLEAQDRMASWRDGRESAMDSGEDTPLLR